MGLTPDWGDFREELLKCSEQLNTIFSDHVFKNAKALIEQTTSFPDRSVEDFKYSDTSVFFDGERSFDAAPRNSDYKTAIPNLPFIYRIIIVDGVFETDLSVLPDGLEIIPLDQLLNSNLSEFYHYLGNVSNVQNDLFCSINTVHCANGNGIFLKKGLIIDKPIAILNFISGINKVQRNYSFPRLFLLAEEKSNANFLEISIDLNPIMEKRQISVSEIVALENSRIGFYRIQKGNESLKQIVNLSVLVKNSAEVDTCTLSMECEWVRNNLSVFLEGDHARAHLNGLFFTDKKQHSDMHTLVEHRAPFCNSNQIYKGILGGKSVGVFNGRILVKSGAQKTNAYQSSKCILLGDDSTMNTKPQLEIFADDVKCSHGSSTGEISPDALFYLQSRGISTSEAKKLLVSAFANEVINSISNDEVCDYFLEETKCILQKFSL